MISTEILEDKLLIDEHTKNFVAHSYLRCGIPVKYHFKDIETAWSTEFSSYQKLTGISKIASERAKVFIAFYIKHIETALSGGGIKVKQKKDSSQIIKNFSLEGGKSSGKTLLLSLIAQTAVNHGYKVLYLDWVEIYNNFQTWDGAAENQRTLDAAKNCDLLCIDSIYNYSLNPTPSFVVLIDQIINHRIKNDLVTICSISASENSLPNLGPIWNQFLRENFTLKLPEATLTYENNTKRSRTKST